MPLNRIVHQIQFYIFIYLKNEKTIYPEKTFQNFDGLIDFLIFCKLLFLGKFKIQNCVLTQNLLTLLCISSFLLIFYLFKHIMYSVCCIRRFQGFKFVVYQFSKVHNQFLPISKSIFDSEIFFTKLQIILRSNREVQF